MVTSYANICTFKVGAEVTELAPLASLHRGMFFKLGGAWRLEL